MTQSGGTGGSPLRLTGAVDDYAKILDEMEARSVANTVAMLRRSLDRVLIDLRRHYAAYLDALGPGGTDPEGNPIRLPGAYSSAEAAAKFRAILQDAQQFLPQEEIKGWRQQFTTDLLEAMAIGGEAAATLQGIAAGTATAQFAGANPLAVRAATQAATAFMEGEAARFRDQIAQIVSEGVARGYGSKRIERDIRAALEGSGDPNGKTARIGLKRRAEIIARSEIGNAYSKGALEHNLNEGFAYIRWIASTDERTCRWCLSRHGRIFPADRVVIPAHPQCRCTPGPVAAEDVEEQDPVLRDTLLDNAFWRDQHEQGVKNLAKNEGISEAAARRLLDAALIQLGCRLA